MLGISQEWLCGHQEIVSVFMVIGSVVGVVAGLILAIGAIAAPVWLWDEMKIKIIDKYGQKARRVYDFIWDKWLLMWVGVGLFAVLCAIFLPGWTWHDLEGIGMLVTLVVVGILFIALIAWIVDIIESKIGDRVRKTISHDTKVKIKRWKERLAITAVGILMLGVAWILMTDLYKWWVLQICG